MIDLSLGENGLLTFRNGEQGFTEWRDNGDNTYDVRYESGWYCQYTKDGKRLDCGRIHHQDGTIEVVNPGVERDIVKVEYVPYEKWMRGGFPP